MLSLLMNNDTKTNTKKETTVKVKQKQRRGRDSQKGSKKIFRQIVRFYPFSTMDSS